jgi:ABC-type phosphate transport system ATPase subunit
VIASVAGQGIDVSHACRVIEELIDALKRDYTIVIVIHNISRRRAWPTGRRSC